MSRRKKPIFPAVMPTEAPEVEVVLIRTRDANLLKIECCPLCTLEHWHGGGEPGGPIIDGHRVAHCRDIGSNPGYELIWKGREQPAADTRPRMSNHKMAVVLTDLGASAEGVTIMVKTNGANGTKEPSNLVQTALAAAREKLADVPGHDLIIGEFCWLVAQHPRGAERDLEVVIREKTDATLERWRNFVRQQFIVPMALAAIRISDDQADAVAQPHTEIEAHLRELLNATWGSRLCDDLGMLRGDYCRALPEHGCARLREGEKIVGIRPSSISVCAPGGEPRTINRLELVASHRDRDFRSYKYDEKIAKPLERLIAEAERKAAEGEKPPWSGIIPDERE